MIERNGTRRNGLLFGRDRFKGKKSCSCFRTSISSSSSLQSQFCLFKAFSSHKMSRKALHSLSTVRSSIFQTTAPQPLSSSSLPPPRTGRKILSKRLLGPSMLQYYPPVISIAAIARNRTLPALRGLRDPREVQRLEDVARRREMGKGPPKKGE